MMRPRWQKLTSDLLSHKGRSLLVIASIAAGLFAVGMVTTSYVIMAQDIRSSYEAINPANIQVVASGFDYDFVNRIDHLAGIEDAQGAWNTSLQVQTSSGEWDPIDIRAQDFGNGNDKGIGVPNLIEGYWPPKNKEIVLDINQLSSIGAGLGDEVEIKLPSGTIRRLKVVGIVRDQTIGSNGSEGGFFLANLQGYVTVKSLGWLEQPERYNTLYATVEGDIREREDMRILADTLVDKFDNNGYRVTGSMVRKSEDHPNLPYVDAMAAVIYALGFLVVFLSGFLITNTFSALLNQQVEQIGIMKTFGASRKQIILMYMVLILVYSAIALAIAIPLSNAAAFGMLNYISGKINFVLAGYRQVPSAILFQVVIALVVPQLAGILPIIKGTRISVREALSGITTEPSVKGGFFQRFIGKSRGVSRPRLISLRNTTRKRGRLLLTLLTLALGGSTFIATLNVRSSLSNYIDQLGLYFLADVNVTLDRPYRVDRVTKDLLEIPGVKAIEGWSGAFATTVTESGKAGENVTLIGPPSDSQLIEPLLLEGRWLQPGDQNAVALSEMFQYTFPDLKVGDTIRLQIGTKKSDWVVVGFFQFAGKSAGLMAYANNEYLARKIGMTGKSATFRIVANDDILTSDDQEALVRRVDAYLTDHNYEVNEVSSGKSLQEKTSAGLDILTTFLLIMSFLMALVGSIGLSGTMSLNVMERTQEIGVMRAIGGSNRAIIDIVLVEGVLIGLISWLLSCLVAPVISKSLADIMFQIIFDHNAALVFTPWGNLIWLALVLLLSAVASVIPALNASRLTIREVLAYE
jgi:putative ABC transport system permease protein